MRRMAEEAPQQWAMSSADRRVYDNVRWPAGAGGIMSFSLHDKSTAFFESTYTYTTRQGFAYLEQAEVLAYGPMLCCLCCSAPTGLVGFW